MPAAVETTNVEDAVDENGAIAEMLDMVVKEIDVVINKAGSVLPDDEDADKGNNDPKVSNMIESLGMGSPNRDLDLTTEWAMFTKTALYDDDDGVESDVMVGQGPRFDRRALEEGSIFGRYACDGWVLGLSGPIVGVGACSSRATTEI